MTSRERLMATLQGQAVDRPALSFYEIGGFDIDPRDQSPFNIYNDPSWQPLLDLAEARTDLIRMRSPLGAPVDPDLHNALVRTEVHDDGDSRISRTTVRIAGRELTQVSRVDRGVNTVWILEHLLRTPDDLHTYMSLPDELFAYRIDVARLVAEEEALGERGIVMLDHADPICMAASLFSMQDFTTVAYTEQPLFHALLEKLARSIHTRVEEVARIHPGRLWRVVGAEYATEPYLPPHLFEAYVTRYTGPMVDAVQRHGGFARLHCHGRLKSALPHIAAMEPAGLDPIEPPPQGDVPLDYVRREYGRDMVLFGNIEVSEIETMESAAFERRVAQAIADGTSGDGRGFVLMPTSCPYGREITPRTMQNYQTMVRLIEEGRSSAR